MCKGTYLIHFLDTIFLTFYLLMCYLYPSPQQEIELHANNACGQEYVIIIYRMSCCLFCVMILKPDDILDQTLQHVSLIYTHHNTLSESGHLCLSHVG